MVCVMCENAEGKFIDEVKKINEGKIGVIVINRHNFNSIKNSADLRNCYMVIDVEDKRGFEFAKQLGGKIIDCGMNRTSTITISSNEEDYLNVCVQRAIKKPKGGIIDEQDVKMNKIEGMSQYEHLALCVCKLLAN